jgi:GNAT superfamily N-acetyltransferase
MTLTIRWASAQDEAFFRILWQQYLEFYNVILTEKVTQSTWTRILDPSARINARFAFYEGDMVGFAVHHHHDSTWVDGFDGYLEDLFVSAQSRSMGAGRALIEDLIIISRAAGWKRLYWHTNEANSRARSLYDSYTQSDGHVRYRIKLE